jgi:hypothetical protein
MRQLWRTLAYLVGLHKAEYTGHVVLSWHNGVIQHTKTESNRTPDELPVEDADLLELMRTAQDQS